MIEVSKRLNTVDEYYFSKKLKEVSSLISKGKPVINLGIGSPDLTPMPNIIEALKNSLADFGAHKYQSYQGINELREAMATFYKNKYDVYFDPKNEILPLMGSKEGIMHISMAYLNENDSVLIPNPGYPTYSSVTKLVGAKPIYYDLNPQNNWQPDLNELYKLDLSNVKVMWINYPNMPTGVSGDKNFLQKLINLANEKDILLVNDNPYSFILNNNPLSIFNFDGSKENCLELNSLSKSFNMAGWRVGMLIGSSNHIQNVLKIKSNMDSGMFYGIQKGAIEALNLPNDWFTEINKIYKIRRRLIWELASKLGCSFDQNSSGLFVWAKLPNGLKSEKFIDYLLYEKKIFVTPGTVFGSNGEGYIRFSLCANKNIINEAIERVK